MMDFVFGLVGLLTALLPGAIIGQHAIYLCLYRKKFTGANPPQDTRGVVLKSTWEGARDREQLEFSPWILFIRYGLPAILLVIVGAVLFFLLWLWPDPWKSLEEPLRFGAAGAYVYILLLLTQRNFQRDITSGTAWWCAATLLLGPLLAAVLGKAWVPEGPPAGPDSTHWAKTSLYFLAGLSPRYVAGTVQEIFRRLWLSGSGTNAPSRRSLPMSLIRGILPEVEDRLAEEGIQDVNSLAMADPHKLLRNTNFDPRVILNWIDEALLIVTLPKHWQDIETEGITGAIDLAWYETQTDAAVRAQLDALAVKVHLDAASLKSTALRLRDDAQVQLIWVLYQSDANDPDDEDNDEDDEEENDEGDEEENDHEEPPAGTQGGFQAIVHESPPAGTEGGSVTLVPNAPPAGAEGGAMTIVPPRPVASTEGGSVTIVPNAPVAGTEAEDHTKPPEHEEPPQSVTPVT